MKFIILLHIFDGRINIYPIHIYLNKIQDGKLCNYANLVNYYKYLASIINNETNLFNFEIILHRINCIRFALHCRNISQVGMVCNYLLQSNLNNNLFNIFHKIVNQLNH